MKKCMLQVMSKCVLLVMCLTDCKSEWVACFHIVNKDMAWPDSLAKFAIVKDAEVMGIRSDLQLLSVSIQPGGVYQ